MNNPDKRSGSLRRIDDLGRVVIPSDTRRRMGLESGTMLEEVVTPDGILLKPVYTHESLDGLFDVILSTLQDNSRFYDPDDYEVMVAALKDVKRKIRQKDTRVAAKEVK